MSAENVHWDQSALALTDASPTRPTLRAVTAAVAREGVRAGMSLAEARALCAKLETRPWDDVAIDAAVVEMTARLVHASPQVSPVPGVPGMWWIGASGFAPGAHGRGRDATQSSERERERAFARELLTIARYWHPRARVAIADTCVAARAATWSGTSFTGAPGDERSLISVIPHGGDAGYLESAPLTLLPMDPEMRDGLKALGIRAIGQFRDLDAGDVEQRWGDDGLFAWRLAHGDDPRRPVLARLDDRPHVEMELSSPAATMEPVLFLVRPGVESLVGQLAAQGRAIAALAITLTLDDARGALPSAQPHTLTREIRLPRPLARSAPLFERCRGLLSRWTLTAPVSAVRLTVMLTGPLTGEQGNLLDTSWRDPGAVEAALERVRAELGAGVVVKPQALDAYVPDRMGEWTEELLSCAQDCHGALAHVRFSATPSARSSSRPLLRSGSADNNEQAKPSRGDGRALTRERCERPSTDHALRLLESPEKVDVDRDQAPRRIMWRGRAITVTSAVGPERLSGDWWSHGFSRDYWRCESTDDVGELVLYRDAAGWWVQGWYD